MSDERMPSGKAILEGLKIILKYAPDCEFIAEHDQVWCCDTENVSQATPEEMTMLKNTRWFVDEDVGNWSHFT